MPSADDPELVSVPQPRPRSGGVTSEKEVCSVEESGGERRVERRGREQLFTRDIHSPAGHVTHAVENAVLYPNANAVVIAKSFLSRRSI